MLMLRCWSLGSARYGRCRNVLLKCNKDLWLKDLLLQPCTKFEGRDPQNVFQNSCNIVVYSSIFSYVQVDMDAGGV